MMIVSDNCRCRLMTKQERTIIETLERRYEQRSPTLGYLCVPSLFGVCRRAHRQSSDNIVIIATLVDGSLDVWRVTTTGNDRGVLIQLDR